MFVRISTIVTVCLIAVSAASYRQHHLFPADSPLAQRLTVANQNIRRNPKDAKAYTIRGSIYDDGGEYEKALADYNTAIRLNPNDGLVYHNRSLVYAAKGEDKKAIADYNKAIKLNPNSISAEEPQ